MKQPTVLLYGVGDLCPNRENPESIFTLVSPTLREADILFGQLETPFSERGAPQMFMLPGCLRAHPKNVHALAYAGFDVVSFASNHTLDWGEEALFDTIDLLKKNGIAIIGAGNNIDEARQPAIIERKGTKIAFLAYNSVLPRGYEAWPDKAGCVPLRAATFYEQVDWQPGTPPRIISFANKDDLEAMKNDIKAVRPLTDVVVMSIHWGVHFTPALIATYQKEIAYAAIDAGVDLVLGHHAHILKGIEAYKGKVIFYSLCNFAFDFPIKKGRQHIYGAHYGWEADPEYPSYAFPADSRKTIIAKCVISNKEIEMVSFLPVMINRQSQPEVLPRSDNRSSEVLEYIDWCCKNQELNTRFSWDGDEVVLSEN